MNLSGNAHAARCGLVWGGITLVGAALLALAAPGLGTAPALLADPAGVPFDRWLTVLCAVAIAACVVWGWLVTTTTVVQALAGRPGATRCGPGVPGTMRRLVLVACGVAVLGASTAAAHASSGDDGGSSLADLLDGLPLPDRAEGPSVAETIGRALTRAARAPHPGPVHEVQPGESLWAISERALAATGHRTDDAAVAEYWHRIHEHNRGRIGADPDLIHPGQELRLPPIGKDHP